jgi:carbon-monoxide dehydrogenase medium subunit
VKPAAFDLAVPTSISHAATLLSQADSRAMGGGQSLGPMLNFRAARPATIVPLTRLEGLRGVEETGDAITFGAATTHAEIADGRTPDLSGDVLARIAAGIAYRAVRNRGTIGGSLCHADPAADWLTTLTALDAVVLTTTRSIGVVNFVTGPYRTVLESGEIARAIRVPKPAPGFRWSYCKLCRKPGEFAHAMAAALRTDAGLRLAIGALGGPPLLLVDEKATAAAATAALGFMEPVALRIQLEAVARVLAEVGA